MRRPDRDADRDGIGASSGGVGGGVGGATGAPRIRRRIVTEMQTIQVPVQREGAEKQYPLGGVQGADDVAAVMDWLLSTDASRITGQVIPVDGGFTTVRPLVK